MTIRLKNIVALIIITLTGLAGSVIVGLMDFGVDVFNPKSAGFSFLSFGLSGGLIFAFYHVRGLSEAITAAVIASAVQFAILTNWITVVHAAIWSFGVNIPFVYLAFVFERKLSNLKQLKFVAVGLVSGMVFVFLTWLAGAFSGVEQLPPHVFRQNFIDGLLMGLGIGIGIEGGEAFVQSLNIPG